MSTSLILNLQSSVSVFQNCVQNESTSAFSKELDQENVATSLDLIMQDGLYFLSPEDNW